MALASGAITAPSRLMPAYAPFARANEITSAVMLEPAPAPTGPAATLTSPPSLKDELSSAYFALQTQIDQIVSQARQAGSLQIALSGLNAIRQTLDSLSRLAGFERQGTQVNVAVQTNLNLDLRQIAERLILQFDREPELKARVAQALLEVDHEQAA